MPRPIKWRRVCCLPESKRFGSLDSPSDVDNIVKMTVDEYETIRLINIVQYDNHYFPEESNTLSVNEYRIEHTA